jgi:SH3-like domain-containing protein
MSVKFGEHVVRPSGAGRLRSALLKWKTIIVVLLIVGAAGAAYYHFFYAPHHRPALEVAYVMLPAVNVDDTPAQVRARVVTLNHGERVDVLERFGDWRNIRTTDGIEGWTRADGLMDEATFDASRKLLRETSVIPAQAEGSTVTQLSLRSSPGRDAPALAQLAQSQQVQIFKRRVVSPKAAGDPGSAGPPEAWYLVRAGSSAGWLVGRLVSLDIPADISMYSEDVNLVAWLVLRKVADNGREVPEYLTADREGKEYDFTHIRVFTWWPKRQQYVTAYVEGRLQGYFPIRVGEANGNPTFRLRLTDEQGRKIQKVYEMFDTVVRPQGTIEGWESQAMPQVEVRPRTRRNLRRR